MTRMNGRYYVVLSQECSEVDPVLDYGQGPREYWRDVLYVHARTARRAKILAVRAWCSVR